MLTPTEYERIHLDMSNATNSAVTVTKLPRELSKGDSIMVGGIPSVVLRVGKPQRGYRAARRTELVWLVGVLVSNPVDGAIETTFKSTDSVQLLGA